MKNRLLSRRGSALATTVILTTLVGVTAAVLLKYSMSEFRLNQRTNLRFQAKDATEAMLEYGSAELMARIQASVNFATNELTSNPLTTPSSRKTTLFAQGTGTWNDVNPTSMRFWASQLSDTTRRLIDPGDPGNDFDPLRGQYASTKIIKLLGQATATAGGVTATSYGTETMEIRDAFLFNYAIFYNITMEFHPGADMTIAGPVHSNVNSYISANSALRFQNAVTAAGTITATPQTNAGGDRPTGKNVSFATGLDLNLDGVPDTIALGNAHNAAANDIRGYNGAVLDDSVYVDSSLASRSTGNTFAAVASQVWRGNVQDSAMGIIAQNLPAITASTPAEAHDLIEPKDTSVTSGSAAAVQSRETQKFSNKAGLYIVQGAPGTDGAASGTPPAPVAFKNSADAAAYKAASNRTTWRNDAANKSKILILPADTVKNNRRMYDHREGRNINTVDIDVGKLRTAVNTVVPLVGTNIKAYDSFTGTYIADWSLDAASGGWNGQVYVEVESPSSGYSSTSDVPGMNASADVGTRTSVRLVNGSSVPNRKAANAAATEGFTLATNAPVYVVGNYNSPGLNSGTRSGTAVGTETTATIGDPKDTEVPTAIVADAINILSTAWWDSGTGKPTGDTNSSAAKTSRVAASTEICAAFLTGNVATVGAGNVNANYSGGVENFPRLHESWTTTGNKTLRYRGSMIALFNSEVATRQWTNASYDAPTREWGFSKLFGTQGRYPPGTPMIRSFRRLDFRDLTATEFNTMLATTSYAFDEM